jgi:ribose transport system permease protein
MNDSTITTRMPSRALLRQLFGFQSIPPLVLVLLLILFGLVDGRVLSSGNLVNIVEQTSYLAIFTLAQMIVLVTRGFDLALGGIASVVSVVTALAMTALVSSSGVGIAITAGLLCGLCFGIVAGLFNGLIIAGLRVNPFVATLGSYNICLGVATTISGGRPVASLPADFGTLVYSGSILGAPMPVIIVAIACLAVHFMFRFTVFGRSLYLVGANERGAMVAGLPTRKIVILAYVVSAMLTALGAIMLTGRTGSGEPNLGGTLTLQSLAAAIVGGASLLGGRGGVGAALFGALFVTILANGMNLAQINGYYQMIVIGGTVIASVVLDRFRSH